MISRIHPTCFLFVFSLRSHKQVKIVYLYIVNNMFDTIKIYFVSAVLRVRTKIASSRLSFLRPCSSCPWGRGGQKFDWINVVPIRQLKIFPNQLLLFLDRGNVIYPYFCLLPVSLR